MTWQSRLVTWYQKNRRDLPWRQTPGGYPRDYKDPYKIWVSEVMLQQTTVEAVIPYYASFLKKFPTLRSLARAPEEEILRLWSGLGYYSRARNLHRAAQIVLKENDGKIPSSAEELRKLPGIGRYTAGAIASIAFNQPAPILDGNVVRLLSRLYAIKTSPQSARGQRTFWSMAGGILPKPQTKSTNGGKFHYGDFNQALMELGATVCLPDTPLCRRCPLSNHCKARREGNPTSYPRGLKKISYRSERWTAALIEKNGRLLMVQRPDHGLLRGMWEFPMVRGRKMIGIPPAKSFGRFPPVRHSILNRRLTIQPFHYLQKNGFQPPLRTPFRWVQPTEIRRLPTSSMTQKVLTTFLAARR